LEATRARWVWPAILVLCVATAGLGSLALRLDANWDLKNYHYYNAYAFLNGRLGWDVAPAQLQTYYNPLMDLPFYFLVNAVASPRAVAFAMAATTGIAIFFFLRILTMLFPAGRVEDRFLWIGLSFVIGATGAAGISVLGSTMNEWPPAMLLMGATWILVSSVASTGRASTRSMILAGLLVGIAAGLKLTYGVFALALVVALGSIGPARARLRGVTMLAGFAGLGFLISYGFWGTILYREFGNPFFPHFNALFASPYWETASLFDLRFGPRGLMQAIAFPLYFARDSQLVSEVSFRDWRLAVLLVLASCCLVKFLVLRTQQPALAAVPADPLVHAWRFLGVFALASYLAWLKLFSIYRYLVPLEMIAGPLIVGCALYLVPGRNARRVAIVILAVLIVGTTRKTSWGRVDFGNRYFDVAVPPVAPNALVVIGPVEPMAYVIAFMPRDARFVSPNNNFLNVGQGNLLQRRIGDIIAKHAGPIYFLEFHTPEHVETALQHYGLVRDKASCQPIRSNLDDNAMRLCRVERLRR
jgi:hypothetical protein